MARTAVFWLALLVLAVGCGGGVKKSYVAQVEEFAKPIRQDPEMSLITLQEKLRAAPRRLHLDGNRFYTTDNGVPVQEGTWRETDKELILRAEIQRGQPIVETVREDYPLKKLPGDRLADENAYRLYGLRLVFTLDK